ncbi:hypothetical protein PRIPAC_72774, partial [Pristionchus pacificus]
IRLTVILMSSLMLLAESYNLSAPAPIAYFSFDIAFEHSGEAFKRYHEDLLSDYGNLTTRNNESIITPKDELTFTSNAFYYLEGTEEKIFYMSLEFTSKMCPFQPFMLPVKQIDLHGDYWVTYAYVSTHLTEHINNILERHGYLPVARGEATIASKGSPQREIAPIRLARVDGENYMHPDRNFISNVFFTGMRVTVCDNHLDESACRRIQQMARWHHRSC